MFWSILNAPFYSLQKEDKTIIDFYPVKSTMNNTFTSKETNEAQPIETKVLENRDKHKPHVNFESLLNVSPILHQYTPLHKLSAQSATLLNSMSSLYDFTTFTSNALKQNVGIAPQTLESKDIPIWPPNMLFPNYRPPQSQLAIALALARYLNPSLYFIQRETSNFNHRGIEHPSIDSLFAHAPAGIQFKRDSSSDNLLIYYDGKEEKKKKLTNSKASHRRNVKRINRKVVNLPKRPLSAYNIFFKDERKKILSQIPDQKMGPKDQSKRNGRKGHGKISFECLAKEIGQRWHSLDSKRIEHYKALASKDMVRYTKDKMTFQELRKEAKNLPEQQVHTLGPGDEDSSISSK
jgi:hypothetical protein